MKGDFISEIVKIFLLVHIRDQMVTLTILLICVYRFRLLKLEMYRPQFILSNFVLVLTDKSQILILSYLAYFHLLDVAHL